MFVFWDFNRLIMLVFHNDIIDMQINNLFTPYIVKIKIHVILTFDLNFAPVERVLKNVLDTGLWD